MVDTLGTTIDDEPAWGFRDRRQFATVIVVAKVEENKTVKKHIEAARYQGVYLDLHAVRCTVENVLRGTVVRHELDFYYFADGRYPGARANPKYKSLYSAKPGRRYLFFLTRERNILRSVGDVGDFSILVGTGAHPDLGTSPSDIGLAVSEVLLNPRSGADFETLAGNLLWYSEISDRWSARPVSVGYLRRLTTLNEPVKSSACAVLVLAYLGQTDCLATLAADPGLPVEKQTAIREEIQKQNRLRANLLGNLKDPARLTYSELVTDSKHRLYEELQTLLMGTDSEVGVLACTALKRYFPYAPDPRCTATAVRQH